MIPAQNRNLGSLHPLFRGPFERWLAAARKAGYRVQPYETHRTQARQDYLYSLGRTRRGHIVTYTRDSSHLYGLAADVMVLKPNGQPDWSWAAYQRLYRAVPPSRYGLELLDFERPHIQLAGIQGPRKNQSPGIWAKARGITPGVVAASTAGRKA